MSKMKKEKKTKLNEEEEEKVSGLTKREFDIYMLIRLMCNTNEKKRDEIYDYAWNNYPTLFHIDKSVENHEIKKYKIFKQKRKFIRYSLICNNVSPTVGFAGLSAILYGSDITSKSRLYVTRIVSEYLEML